VAAPPSPTSATRKREPHLFAREFEHRSGRIIALCRFALATTFFIALWVAPDQPVRSGASGYVILFGYMLLALLLLAIAWRSWWWDQRLAGPMHLLDVTVFLAAVYFTEADNDSFTSPFLAFFAFLLLSATIRWDWRVTGATSLGVAGLYLLGGLAMQSFGVELGMLRFERRLTYMVVLSLVLVWFGLQRRAQAVERFVEPPGSAEDPLPPMLEALRYAMAQTNADRGAIAWADDEEPHVEVRALGLDCPTGRLSPEALSPDEPFARAAQLYDTSRVRTLRLGGRRIVASRGTVADPLARHCGLAEGLALPFGAVTGRGAILLGGIPGVCADHVELGALIAREIGAGFDRQSTLALVRESAISRIRDGVARDLHDTIAQSLAGVSLRLEGLRRWIRDGGDADAEIQSIKTAVRAEQSQVRGMIERLRDGESVLPDGAASRTLDPLLRDLAGYWGIEIEMEEGGKGIVILGRLAHELRQLLREAVANAVRHGGAGKVAIALGQEDAMLRLTIVDDGTGFPAKEAVAAPRSISERIAALGGALEVETGAAGTALRFAVPMEER
jgi:signal transduction histidine kinase